MSGSMDWREIHKGSELLLTGTRIVANNWLWNALAEIPNGRYSDLVEARTEQPHLSPNAIGMLFLRKRIFVNVTKLAGVDGAALTLAATGFDAVVSSHPSAGAALAILRFVRCSRLIDEDEREFLCVLLGQLEKGSDPYTVPVDLAAIARSYAKPEHEDDGTSEALRIAERLEKKGIVTLGGDGDSKHRTITLVR